MGHYELPLVFFTVISQATVGALLLIALLDGLTPESEAGARKGLRLIGMAIFPLIALALLASMTHLGQPLAAARALRHVAVSWLSREIWAFSTLALLTAAYSYLWWKGGTLVLRRTLGFASSLVGLAGVWTTAMVYALPARPAWNGGTNLAAFLATCLLLGALIVATVVRWQSQNGDGSTAIVVAGWAAVAGLLTGVLSIGSSFLLAQGNPQVVAVALSAVGSWLFWFRLAIGLILPALVIGWMILRRKELTTSAALLALCGAVIGELAGRAVFYASTMSQSPWG